MPAIYLSDTLRIRDRGDGKWVVDWYNSATEVWEEKWRIDHDTGELELTGAFVQDITIKKDTPKVIFEGTETNARKYSYREDAGKIIIKDETAGVDVCKIDITTGNVELIGNFTQDITIRKDTPQLILEGTETGGDKLSLRENAGKVEIYDPDGAVVKVDDLINRHHLKDPGDVSASVGGSGSPASTDVLTLATGENHILPLAVKVTVVAGTGETVTARVLMEDEAGTQYELFSASATGGTTTTDKGIQDFALAMLGFTAGALDGHRIVKIVVTGESSLATPSATAAITVRPIAQVQ